MNDLGLSILFGLALGFLFGVGCALAVVHAVYRRGYRKAVADSLEPVKPKFFKESLEAVKKQRALLAATRAAELGVELTAPSADEPPQLPPSQS